MYLFLVVEILTRTPSPKIMPMVTTDQRAFLDILNLRRVY